MSFPLGVPIKAWDYSVNITLAATANAAEDFRQFFLRFKNELVNFGWTVVASSNGVTTGASDLWSTTADIVIVASSGNHSWIVLRQSTTGIEILIDAIVNNVTNAACVGFYGSYSDGFSGGTVSARPTATDEATVATGASGHTWKGTSQSQNIALVLHMWHAQDDSFTAWSINYNGLCIADGFVGLVERARYPDAAILCWNSRLLAGVPVGQRFIETFDQNQTPHRMVWLNIPDEGPVDAWPLLLVVGSASSTGQARAGWLETLHSNTPSDNQIRSDAEGDNVDEAFEIPVVAKLAGSRALVGYLPDMHWAGDNRNTGDRGVIGGVARWVKMGTVWRPWPGGAVTTT